MRKYSQDLQLLSELETDHLDIAKLRQQRQLVARVQSSLLKKDEEIAQLRSLLEKYQQYQQKYTSLKVELTERAHLMAKKDNECKLLRRQMEELMQEQGDHHTKIKQYQTDRQAALCDRHQMQTAHKQIELTFKEYQAQFRKRENELSFDLERAYQQVKDANARIDQLELIAEEKRVLQDKLREVEKLRTEERQKTPKRRESSSKQKTEPETHALLDEMDRLKRELLAKQEQLASNRVLNYELTLQYDSSINGICSLQTQLSSYRKENNELKKILSLLREQEKCREIEQKYTLRHQTRMGTPESEEEVSGMDDDLPTHKFQTHDALAMQS